MRGRADAYSGGLKRNIVQCLNDYGIPLKLSHTVIDIQGRERVTRGDHRPGGREVEAHPRHGGAHPLRHPAAVRGLIPENELSGSAGITLHP